MRDNTPPDTGAALTDKQIKCVNIQHIKHGKRHHNIHYTSTHYLQYTTVDTINTTTYVITEEVLLFSILIYVMGSITIKGHIDTKDKEIKTLRLFLVNQSS